MSEIELKPCPFCGSRARLREFRDALEPQNISWIVECDALGCYARCGTLEEDQEDAAEHWNRRPSEPVGGWKANAAAIPHISQAPSPNTPTPERER